MEELFWLLRFESWFAFDEPAKFVEHRDGGFFVSQASGEQIYSVLQNGCISPERGIAPWAERRFA